MNVLDKFRKREISRVALSFKEDKAVSVKALMALIENHKYYEDIRSKLGIDEVENEYITILGARKLVSVLKTISAEFIKIDIEAEYNDLEFIYNDKNKSFDFHFFNAQSIQFVDKSKEFDLQGFIARPIHSAQSEFFSSLFNMNKYASTLIENGLQTIVQSNLQLLKNTASSDSKSYRIIKHEEDYFFRALTSNKYKDYNIDISTVLVLITLHKNTSELNSYSLTRVEYNQSSIKLFLEKPLVRNIEGLGNVKFFLEMSNDELRREAIKLSLGFNIIYGDKNNSSDNELFIKPEFNKSKILSISHGNSLQRAMESLQEIENLNKVEDELLKDLETVKKVKDVDQIRHLLKRKIENAKDSSLSMYKKDMMKVLEFNVKNIHELLVLMKKIDVIAEDIDAKEYLRYFMYQVLTSKKN